MGWSQIEKDIIRDINKKIHTASYDLPYVLTSAQTAELFDMIEKAPTAYSINIEESATFPSGIFLSMERLEA